MIFPAKLWQRFFARIIDGLIVGVPIVFILSFTAGYEFVINPGANFIFNIFMILIVTAYMIVLPVIWYGWTIGKRLMGIRVTEVDGADVSWQTMLKRELFILVVYSVTFGLFLLLSCVMMITRKDKRALHDLMAKTKVSDESGQ
ncbi:RDD family protein [Salinicoccus halitifaciens]|uniref:RDD family membrane protein YckC n=1 Tax=Salinicoccus halitifaciens TaxID=1073415 RepID=A0ABV2EBL5_9STAP|nr:RDD family protein [Salinicoccus halitifaciens]MCD2138964.1 RDD family protein [Salinicoccus halitifaciens]